MSSLKAVGVFWDIENCHVPKGKSALKVIERIRERFFHDSREAEFICVCDITKESESTIKDLNDGQINVVHINATAKNAADDKIRQSMRRFSDSHPPGTKVILISSDVNFASDLSDLRHRKKFEVVLIHKAQVSEALLTCANEHYLYEDLTSDLPETIVPKDVVNTVCVAFGYDKDAATEKVSAILKMLSSNCGGKVISIGPHYALLKFSTVELMERAKKRMNGADVYGRRITVCLPDESPFQLNTKKWNQLSQRGESPSPQRRPARERRNSSRSYTPEEGRQFGMGRPRSGSRDELITYPGQTGGDLTLIPATDLPDIRDYRTPGGPTLHARKTGTSGTNLKIAGFGSNGGNVMPGGENPVSPNGPHALPNSRSARYYTNNVLTPGDFQHKDADKSEPEVRGDEGHAEGRALLQKLTGGKGSSPVVGQQMSLKDIPLPPSGYQHMPPPNMPVKSTVDPIKLFEKTSQDSQQLWTPGILGPPPNQTTGAITQSQQFHPSAFFKHPEPAAGGKRQDPSPQIQPNQSDGGQPQQHQARSKSVPGPAHTSSDDTICMMHGYPPPAANNHRSQSHGGHGKQEPWQQQQQQGAGRGRGRGRHNSGGFKRRTSPGRRDGNGQPSPTMDQSPCRPSTPGGSQGFRPRLPSAPAIGLSQSTPSPFSVPPPPIRPQARHKGSNIYRCPTPVEIGDPSVDYFNPEFRSDMDSYVELIVSNLDFNISPQDWRKIIFATFQPHVKILSIQVRLQADNTSVATLRLPTEQDARFAIAQYHRRKIGYKRISVQLRSDCSHSPAESLRLDTIALLMEERENKMPLSRLIDLFDKRFHKTVSVSDVYKMRDTIQITESGGGGRWVRLQPGIRRTPTPTQGSDEVVEASEHRVCQIHCPENSPQYVEALNRCMLPNVLLLRKHFSPQLHSLLLSHNGFIPLMSFPACYAAEFSPIECEKEGGIPLEHVISCVPGVEICVSKSGVKMIQFQQNREPFYDLMKGSAWQELGKISREVMELLRQQPHCTMPVSKFIPAYHHHFGRQCRVADYGYTKLQELFEAIPHAIQILGAGDRRAITLSPRAQLKRFTTDIVKVVKAQPTKQILLDKFSIAYEETMGKPLFLSHYGVCHIEDVLGDIPTTTLIVIEEGSHVLLALPRRDQTAEEVERTKKFALEVVDLLKTCPQCCMAFNKFIPAYHHHFGRQCKVADYGYSKLVDLFEAVGHVVRLEEEGEERLIQLSVTEMRSVLIEQLTSLLRQAGAVPVNKLQQAFASRYNFGIKLSDYGAENMKDLLIQLKNHIKIEVYNGQEFATVVKEFQIPGLGLQVMQLLMDESGGCLPLQELCTRYKSTFGKPCELEEIKDKLGDYIQVEESGGGGGLIRLSLQQSLGRNLRLLLLHRSGDRLPMSELYALYRQQYGVDLSPALYGFPSLYQLLLSFPHILEVRGKPTHKYIMLSNTLSTPGVLPPARVDVTPPQQSNYSETSQSGQVTAALARQPSSGPDAGTLIHASQLWDDAIISQSPPSAPPVESSPNATSTRIMKMLSDSTAALAAASLKTSGGIDGAAPSTRSAQSDQGMSATGSGAEKTPVLKQNEISKSEKSLNLFGTSSLATGSEQSTGILALSPNGVPIAWQMLPGAPKIVSGNLSSTVGEDCSAESGQQQQQDGSKQDEEEEDDLFCASNQPLDTSSATSQLNSSSQSSLYSPVKQTSSSPVKNRRPNSRIAAKFGQ